MKKLAGLFIAIIATLAFVSCKDSNSEKLDIISLASSTDTQTSVIKLNKLLENAGCSINSDGSIDCTKAINTLARYFGDDANSLFLHITNTKGADYSRIIIKTDSSYNAVVAWQLTDQKAFENSLAEEWNLDAPAKGEDGYNVYAIDDNASMYVGNDAAVIVYDKKGTNITFAQVLAECAENPLAEWQKAAICNDNAVNCLLSLQAICQNEEIDIETMGIPTDDDTFGVDIQAVKSGYAKIECDVDGPKLAVKMYALDSDGKIIESGLTKMRTIDTSLFKYSQPDNMFAIGASFKPGVDWMTYFDLLAEQFGGYPVQGIDRKTAKMIADVMIDLDGTVLITAAPLNLNRIDNITSWQYMAVGQFKDGAAKKYLDQVYSKISDINKQYKLFLGEDAIKCNYTGTSLDVTLSTQLQVYAKVIDNALVVSSSPIAESDKDMLLQPSCFDNMIIGAEATINKDSKLLSGFKLPFQPTIAITTDGKELDFTFAIDGDKNILDAVFTFIAGQI